MTQTEPNAVAKHLLANLNSQQQKAVRHGPGPLLVLAGAGSGKTRVLVHRIAYLIEVMGVAAANIIAMTFTNKAAGEMRDRVAKLLPKSADGMWVGTFHSLFARLLRREAEHLGFGQNFVIYDTKDQENLIKQIMNELHINQQQVAPKTVARRLSSAKNSMITPEEFERSTVSYLDEQAAIIYHHYRQRLKSNNAMDFDDLLIHPIELFHRFPPILAKYQDRFQYILVDEYQDTNHAQYLLLKLLAAQNRNLCVVGDDDQSIYGWRGADVTNILNFERDYPDTVVIRLEQNYRSTKNILNAAQSVVANNLNRHQKQLWTQADEGEKVSVVEVMDEEHEAESIVYYIEQEFQRRKRNFKDFSILYRTNAQSRAIEDALRKNGIAYVIVGGVRFYERKEVKDVLAYLRVLVNPSDSVSLRRIINYPVRGIGETTVAKINQYAQENRIGFYQALQKIKEIDKISERIQKIIGQFWEFIEKYRGLSVHISAKEIVSALIEELGILQVFKQEATEESLGRMENVRELMNAIAQFSERHPGGNLAEYLEEVALVTDIDTWDDRANAVTLMTLHAAKGLEFPVVFIAGLEDGLFPLSRSDYDRAEIEEERRLFYVGATRAREKLYTTWARHRRLFGERQNGIQSRFLRELDPRYIMAESRLYASESFYARPSRKSAVDSMPAYEDFSQEDKQLNVGCRVRHSRFGTGEVVAISGSVRDRKVTVRFKNYGIKKLVLQYANLQIL